MKQKNKVSKNWLLILILTIFELIYIHYVLMQNLEIFFESNFTYFLKLDIVCVCFNLIYVLYIVDFYKNKHKNKNIMKIYKNDINYQFKNVYLFFQIVKTIAFCFVEKRLMLQFIILEVILSKKT